MATVNIKELKKALEDAEGDTLEIADLMSKDEVNAVIRDRLAREKPKQSELESQLQQEQAAKAELEQKLREIAEEKETKGKTEVEKLLKEIEARDAKLEAWQQRANEQEQTAKAIKQRLYDGHLSRALQNALLAAGANQMTIEQAARIARDDHNNSLQVIDENGKLSVKATTPDELQQPIELNKLASGWLEKNPHFAAPSPSGSGQTGGRPAQSIPSQESRDGMTGFERLREFNALAAQKAKPQ
jgi:hypothetical protein